MDGGRGSKEEGQTCGVAELREELLFSLSSVILSSRRRRLLQVGLWVASGGVEEDGRLRVRSGVRVVVRVSCVWLLVFCCEREKKKR